MLKAISLSVASLFVCACLSAQSFPSAEGHGMTVWVGAQFSMFNPDYGCPTNSPFSCWKGQLFGISPYADANHLLTPRIGAEGEARFLVWHGNTQATYLVGPRAGVVRFRSLAVSGKFLFGDGHISIPSTSLGRGDYFVYAPGVTFDYRLSSRLAARVDYEYQLWPSFKGQGTGSGGLTPNGFSFGLSYGLLR